MKDTIKIAVATLIFLVALSVCYLVVNKEETPQDQFGSVMRGGEYHSTSTLDGDGNAFTYGADKKVLIASTTPYDMVNSSIGEEQRVGSLYLGSVIVASSSAAELVIYNATSTSDDCGGATSTVASIANVDDVQNSQGTYTFDIIMDRGILLEFKNGFNGAYTITWR